MKKERNCQGSSYPVYPVYGGYMPQMPVPAPIMPNNQMMPAQQIAYPTGQTTTNYQTQDNLSNIQSQINNLERRVSRLENMVSNQPNTSYSESNFYMV